MSILLLSVIMTSPDPSKAGEDDKTNPPLDGFLSVRISEKRQDLAGIKTMVLNPTQPQLEFEAIGKVISIQPLLMLRERYLITKAELNAAKAKARQMTQNIKRQEELFKQGITPKRLLQENQAQQQNSLAQAQASTAKLTATANEAKLNWGNTIANWILSDKATAIKELVSGKHQLLQVVLPANKQLPANLAEIAIDPSGKRSQARTAQFISSSALADDTLQGASYYFYTNAIGLTIGTKVSAWIPETNSGQSGFNIPLSAVIWYLDQSYVYVKTANDTFSRRPITNASETPDGYFVTEGLKADEDIVTTGGQVLLSEEIKGQIPDED